MLHGQVATARKALYPGADELLSYAVIAFDAKFHSSTAG